jgi:gamma-glutamyltranspeptidase/glutathione hydrolase
MVRKKGGNAREPARYLPALLLLFACGGAHAEQTVSAPEGASGFQVKPTVAARRFVAVTANPHATQAAYSVLREGGSAVDAAVASQMVLNLVEPQSSGIGGGGFLIHYDARRRRLRAYDGRETAPAQASPAMLLGPEGRPLGHMEAVVGGRSVGVPGLLRMLELAHWRHGRLPWQRLFDPAIGLAERGFEVSPRLHKALAEEKHLLQPQARSYFYDEDGAPWPVGHRLRNPAFAEVLRRVAIDGAEAFYRGDIAKEMVAAVRSHAANPGTLAEEDLEGYRAKERVPLCASYRSHRMCGMPPPGSGTSTVLAMLGMLERFNLREVRPNSAFAAHLLSEAGRLAYADRDRYLADPDFVAVPVDRLLAPRYLEARSRLMRVDASMGRAEPGAPSLEASPARVAEDDCVELPATSHLSIVDRDGNAVSMTSSIEAGFGSRLMARGFLLNNQLTDFAFSPFEDGRPKANRVEPGKRPRSSMAPMMVFDRSGRLRIVIGSPGGAQIINYVAKTLVALIDWGMPPDVALGSPHAGSRNGPTELEKDTLAEEWTGTLRSLGHDVRVTEMNSGLNLIVRGTQGWLSAADPRREGSARGD